VTKTSLFLHVGNIATGDVVTGTIMATAASVTTDLTTCPICLEVFDNPKALPCLHTFCLKCLQGHFKDKCPGDDVPCPVCRKEFQIPSDGLSELQHHFFMQHLIDTRNASSRSTDEVLCQACLEENEDGEGDVSAATMYCVDCNESLCQKCSRHHRRTSMKGGAHQVRPLGAELEQELVQLRGSYCDKHTDKRVELYCSDCKENICVLCFAVKHRQHESGEIPEVAKTFAQQITSNAQRVWSLIHNVLEKAQEKAKKRNQFLKQADKVKSEIKVTGNQIKEIVDCQVAMQLDKVEMIKSENGKKAQTVEERYQLALVAMESFHTYSRELLDKGRPSDITRAASELHKRATELLDNDVSSVQYCPPHVTFTPADVTQVKHLNLIGEVNLEDETQPGTSSTSYLLGVHLCAYYVALSKFSFY